MTSMSTMFRDMGTEPTPQRRTRGGWVPAGTGAERRATHATRGTKRGQLSRQLILDAARGVFEDGGYIDTTIEDIVVAAGVARGSFYTYFSSKSDIFRVLAVEVADQIDESVSPTGEGDSRDAVTALARSNLRYVQMYRQHSALYGLIEQVSTVDSEIHQLRLDGRRSNVTRVADRVRGWQSRGLADPDVDPSATAAALVSMTSNLCFWSFVGGDDADEEQVAATITDLWVRAVGLRQRPPNSNWTEGMSDA